MAGDHLGSASYATSTQGSNHQLYTPYGASRGGTGTPTDTGYTGQLNDGNGLYHYNARYYDPTLAQFTQPDTIVPSPGLGQDWNRYAYVRNNPLRYIDVSGHWPDKPDWMNVGTLHTVLDVVGMVPVVGEVADVANAVIYVAEGDYTNAALSGMALIPIVGSAATSGRLAAKVGTDLATHADDAVKLADDAIETTADVIRKADDVAPNTTRGLPELARPDFVNNAGTPIRSFVTEADTTYYRVFSGDRNVGGFLTGSRPVNADSAVSGLALPPGNRADFIQEVLVPGRTRMRSSVATEAFGQPGGLLQFELFDQIPIKNFGQGVPFR